MRNWGFGGNGSDGKGADAAPAPAVCAQMRTEVPTLRRQRPDRSKATALGGGDNACGINAPCIEGDGNKFLGGRRQRGVGIASISWSPRSEGGSVERRPFNS